MYTLGGTIHELKFQRGLKLQFEFVGTKFVVVPAVNSPPQRNIHSRGLKPSCLQMLGCKSWQPTLREGGFCMQKLAADTSCKWFVYAKTGSRHFV